MYHNGANFTTSDNDNDESSRNCATLNKSGNWYKGCRFIDLNQQPPYVFPHGSVLR